VAATMGERRIIPDTAPTAELRTQTHIIIKKRVRPKNEKQLDQKSCNFHFLSSPAGDERKYCFTFIHEFIIKLKIFEHKIIPPPAMLFPGRR